MSLDYFNLQNKNQFQNNYFSPEKTKKLDEQTNQLLEESQKLLEELQNSTEAPEIQEANQINAVKKLSPLGSIGKAMLIGLQKLKNFTKNLGSENQNQIPKALSKLNAEEIKKVDECFRDLYTELFDKINKDFTFTIPKVSQEKRESMSIEENFQDTVNTQEHIFKVKNQLLESFIQDIYKVQLELGIIKPGEPLERDNIFIRTTPSKITNNKNLVKLENGILRPVEETEILKGDDEIYIHRNLDTALEEDLKSFCKYYGQMHRLSDFNVSRKPASENRETSREEIKIPQSIQDHEIQNTNPETGIEVEAKTENIDNKSSEAEVNNPILEETTEKVLINTQSLAELEQATKNLENIDLYRPDATEKLKQYSESIKNLLKSYQLEPELQKQYETALQRLDYFIEKPDYDDELNENYLKSILHKLNRLNKKLESQEIPEFAQLEIDFEAKTELGSSDFEIIFSKINSIKEPTNSNEVLPFLQANLDLLKSAALDYEPTDIELRKLIKTCRKQLKKSMFFDLKNQVSNSDINIPFALEKKVIKKIKLQKKAEDLDRNKLITQIENSQKYIKSLLPNTEKLESQAQPKPESKPVIKNKSVSATETPKIEYTQNIGLEEDFWADEDEGNLKQQPIKLETAKPEIQETKKVTTPSQKVQKNQEIGSNQEIKTILLNIKHDLQKIPTKFPAASAFNYLAKNLQHLDENSNNQLSKLLVEQIKTNILLEKGVDPQNENSRNEIEYILDGINNEGWSQKDQELVGKSLWQIIKQNTEIKSEQKNTEPVISTYGYKSELQEIREINEHEKRQNLAKSGSEVEEILDYSDENENESDFEKVDQIKADLQEHRDQLKNTLEILQTNPESLEDIDETKSLILAKVVGISNEMENINEIIPNYYSKDLTSFVDDSLIYIQSKFQQEYPDYSDIAEIISDIIRASEIKK
jgi:hypothetical protein